MFLHMNDQLTSISVVRDFDLFNTCIRDNNFFANTHHVVIDNRSDNQGIPARYNTFLEQFDYSRPSWLIFVHEDFELLEDIRPKLSSLDKHALYGPIGCSRRSLFGIGKQVFNGQIDECERNNPAHRWKIGRPISRPTRTETFDCCCMIAHSSLVQKHCLRFDENLKFDLYVEDFCANASTRYGINSLAIPIQALHHSGSKPTQRLTRHLPYLAKKYPRNCFTATCTYFGTMPPMMRLQMFLMGRKPNA